ncbi:hypothetical protein L7F22_050090 [Adiantum nelumboides]|nr:hypothetical protein [Adiantum nelumboides]
MQAADARLQKSLEQLLEDASGEIGLTSNWKLAFEEVNVIVKRQMRVDKLIVTDSSEASDEEVKDKSATLKHMLEEPVLDDLNKGIQELNLNLKVVKLEGFSSKGSTSNARPRPLGRACMWCDSHDHEHRDCDNFNEAYKKNIFSGKTIKSILEQQVNRFVSILDKVPKKKMLKLMENFGLMLCRWLKGVKYLEEDYVKLEGVKSKANEAWVEEKCKLDEEAVGTSKELLDLAPKKKRFQNLHLK